MREIRFKTEEESWEEQSKTGRYNPASVAILKNGKRLTLGTGSRDSVGIWKEGENYYVVCHNSGLGYFGIEEYQDDNGKLVSVGGVFFQEDYNMRDFLESNSMKESSLGANLRTLKALLDYIY